MLPTTKQLIIKNSAAAYSRCTNLFKQIRETIVCVSSTTTAFVYLYRRPSTIASKVISIKYSKHLHHFIAEYVYLLQWDAVTSSYYDSILILESIFCYHFFFWLRLFSLAIAVFGALIYCIRLLAPEKRSFRYRKLPFVERTVKLAQTPQKERAKKVIRMMELLGHFKWLMVRRRWMISVSVTAMLAPNSRRFTMISLDRSGSV